MQRRSGYALFQLLAVLAVLLLLLAMLLPALQRVRIAAARMQSQNNLKQIGIAVHSHHDTNGQLPMGCDNNHFSALAHLLPYVEQDAVYRAMDRTKDVTAAANATGRAVIIKTFLSPLDEATERPDDKAGATSYFAVAGSKPALEDNDGFFPQGKAVRFADVTDGLSNTLVVIESLRGNGVKKAETVARQHVRLKKADLKGIKESAGVTDWKAGKNIAADRGASWADGRFLKASTTVTRKVNDARPDADCEGAGGLAGPRSFDPQFNVLMGDGSVRSVAASVSLRTLQAAATRAGGEVLGNDW